MPLKHKKTETVLDRNVWWNAVKSRKLMLMLIDVTLCSGVGLVFTLLYNQTYTLGNRMLGLGILLGCIFISRYAFNIYRQVWRYATSREFFHIVRADMTAGIVYILLSRLLFQNDIQIMFWQALSMVSVSCLATLSARFIYQSFLRTARDDANRSGITSRKNSRRFFRRIAECLSIHPFYAASESMRSTIRTDKVLQANEEIGSSEHTISTNKINVAIVGAGSVGVLLARELILNGAAHYNPYCFIDIDKQKVGNIISGIRVYPEKGIIKRLQNMPVQEIIIALPDLSGDEKQRLYEFYKKSNCKVKLYDFPFGNEDIRESKRVLREFEIEDLLARDTISFDANEVIEVYQGKTILITGGGGSIGSELCRQLAKLEPHRLVIYDVYENSAYDIEQELISKYGNRIEISVEIGSIRDNDRLAEVFGKHRPQIVFHAAAHKHVPLMEHSCGEAIKNNVIGTLNTANVAEQFGVERFLLVSTDKAVNPTNIMGASKRLCEMIIQSKKYSNTTFMAVRFGNVLGSNGSVIPLFKKQIASGGPITLTDKRIIRYFMTIPEAAQLLVQTCAMAAMGEIFVLDMGRPVKILELAENMIRMSGLTPYVDIDIHEIGLRPGEKLYEELLMRKEQLQKTSNGKIFIEREQAPSEEELQEKLETLTRSLACHSYEAVIDAMRQTVSTYRSAEEINHSADQAEEIKICNGNSTI